MKTYNVDRKVLTVMLLLPVLLISACSVLLATETPMPELDMEGTRVGQTAIAEWTQLVPQSTPTDEPTPIPPTAVPTSVPATSTPLPTSTSLPTPIVPQLPCNEASFVKDVSVVDATQLLPGERFRKIWRLKNIGACTWTPGYDLVFVGGDQLGAKTVIPLHDYVLPGSTVDVYAEMTAPQKPESYRGHWMLRDEAGSTFGLGDESKGSFWVDIQVVEPERKTIYDFAGSYCEAAWESGAGPWACEASSKNQAGFVQYLDNPRLENRWENEPAIGVHPNLDREGWIRGTYPAMAVKEGDRFRAWVGCMDDSKGCRVDFELSFRRAGGGPVKNLGTWREKYDGEVTVIDLDLSSLAGKKVHLILSVSVANNKPEKANAFWFVPRIDRVVK